MSSLSCADSSQAEEAAGPDGKKRGEDEEWVTTHIGRGEQDCSYENDIPPPLNMLHDISLSYLSSP
jgi:hypothetical protein